MPGSHPFEQRVKALVEKYLEGQDPAPCLRFLKALAREVRKAEHKVHRSRRDESLVRFADYRGKNSGREIPASAIADILNSTFDSSYTRENLRRKVKAARGANKQRLSLADALEAACCHMPASLEKEQWASTKLPATSPKTSATSSQQYARDSQPGSGKQAPM